MRGAAKKDLSRLDAHYLLNNIKGVLIFFLVLYHFVSGNMNATQSQELQGLNTTFLTLCAPIMFLVLCAVPIFVFITGYGSKNPAACREDAVSLYLIPYFLINLAMVAENLIFQGFPIRYSPLQPLLQTWYLLSLFWWMFLLKDLVRIKGILVISFVVMFLVGVQVNNSALLFSMNAGTFLGVSRTLYFLPVLLLGYRFTHKKMCDLRRASSLWGVLAAVVFVVGSVGTVLWTHGDERLTLYAIFLLKGDATYDNYLRGLGSWWKVNLTGTALTVILLLLTAALLYCALRFMPKKRIPFLTRLGESSLTVFCLHGLIVAPIGRLLAPYGIYLALSVGMFVAVGVCFLLSMPAVHKTYTRFIFWIGNAIMRKS